MPPTTDRLSEYLVPDEPLRNVYPATLADDSAPEEVSLGVTDRRLLCLAEDGSVLTVGYDSICAIRSRQRSTVSCRGNDYRLVIGGGAVLALVAFAALVAFSSTLAVPALGLTAVGALAASAFLVVHADAVDRVTLDDVEARMADDFDGVDALRRADRALPDAADGRHVLLALCALVAVAALAGTAAVASTPLVLLLVPVLAGMGLVDYGRRHAAELDGIEISRERARNVRIRTDDGRSIRLDVDPSADADRELSRLAFVEEDATAPTVSARA